MKKLLLSGFALLSFAVKSQCPPDVSASLFSTTLTCYNPTILATGSSTTANTVISWIVPGIPSVVATSTVIIGDPQNGPAISTVALTYANYTVVATNTAAGSCQSTSVITISQNFKQPISSPAISISNPTAITCNAQTAPVVLTTGNSTTTSGGGPTAFVANPCWAGPSPQTPTCGQSSYSCYVPGVYTLQVTDNYNGCLGTGTINVIDNRQLPMIANPYAIYTMQCSGAGQVNLTVAITGTYSGGLRYLYTNYPAGAAFNPTAAITLNVNPLLSGTTSSVVTVDKLGTYVYVVTNTLTGCHATGSNVVRPAGQLGQITISYAGPSCTNCCNGVVNVFPPSGFTGYNMSVNQGTMSGSPTNSVSNICNGVFKYCFASTSSACSFCDSILMYPGVGIRKINAAMEQVIIYPNPSNGNIFIRSMEGKNGNIAIYNLEGKMIETMKLEGEAEIKDLKAGIYFIELNMEGSISRKKIIVMN
jgi:hypothetical protein